MHLNNYLLKNGKVLFENGFEIVDIYIENGVIKDISTIIYPTDKYDNVIDCKNLIITPGFIDVHVHLRDPGFEQKEDIISGQNAALKGGFTTIYAMPNTKPVMDDADKIKLFNKRVEKLDCNIKTFSAISKGLDGKKIVDIKNISKMGVAGFSDDGVGLKSNVKIKEAMELIKETDSIISVHAEDIKELPKNACINEGKMSQKYKLPAINNASEFKMVRRDLRLIKDIPVKYHVCHVSTLQTVKLMTKAKKKGLNVSMEVTPHHLIFSDVDIKEHENNVLNTNYKMNPPLRSKKDKYFLIKALNEGVIDIIATDHAPHTKEEKDVHFKKAPFGIIGLEQAYSALNTYLIQAQKVSEETILKALTYNPAARFNEKKGIKVGQDADLVILNPTKEVVFTEDNIVSKSKNTPLLNEKLKGKVCMTILKDKVYNWFEDGGKNE